MHKELQHLATSNEYAWIAYLVLGLTFVSGCMTVYWFTMYDKYIKHQLRYFYENQVLFYKALTWWLFILSLTSFIFFTDLFHKHA
jgi:hypothetical protein